MERNEAKQNETKRNNIKTANKEAANTNESTWLYNIYVGRSVPTEGGKMDGKQAGAGKNMHTVYMRA